MGLDFPGAAAREAITQSSPQSSSAPELVLVRGAGAARLSRGGKTPRALLSAAREQRDTAFRGRMQEARVQLGREFYSDEQKTLATLRLARGYSQHQLAAAVGSTQPHIAKIEAGFTNIYLVTAKNISQALGIGLDDFYALLHAEVHPGAINER